MSYDGFVQACRHNDTATVTSMIRDGFPAYLYVGAMLDAVCDDGDDTLFDLVVRYLTHHPLNKILDGGFLAIHRERVLEYEVYRAIRDDDALRLRSVLTDYRELPEHANLIDLDVRLLSRLTARLSARDRALSTEVVNVLRDFRRRASLWQILAEARSGGPNWEPFLEEAPPITVLWTYARIVGVADTFHTVQQIAEDPDFRRDMLSGILLTARIHGLFQCLVEGLVAGGHHRWYWAVMRDVEFAEFRVADPHTSPIPHHYVASCRSGDYHESLRILRACLPAQYTAWEGDLVPDPDFAPAVRGVFSEETLREALTESLDRGFGPDPRDARRLVRFNVSLLIECYGATETLRELETAREPASYNDMRSYLESYTRMMESPLLSHQEPEYDPEIYAPVTESVVAIPVPTDELLPNWRSPYEPYRNALEWRLHHRILDLCYSSDKDPDTVVSDVVLLLDYARGRGLKAEISSRRPGWRTELLIGLYYLYCRGVPGLIAREGEQDPGHKRMVEYLERRQVSLRRVVARIGVCEDVTDLVAEFLVGRKIDFVTPTSLPVCSDCAERCQGVGAEAGAESDI